MKLHIISPQKEETYSIEHLEAHTAHGSVIVQRGHAPIILSLMPGTDFSFVLTTGETNIIQITRPGFLEIDRSSATALLNQDIK